MKTQILKLKFTILTLLFSAGFIHSQITVDTFPAGEVTEFTVPVGVTEISITATGGSGGESNDGTNSASGGCGAEASATFPVNPGDVLNIIVGAGGGSNTDDDIGDGGGGGGTAVINMTQGNTVLLVAGGGGGGAIAGSPPFLYTGENSSATSPLGNGGAIGVNGGAGGGANSAGDDGNNGDTGGAAGLPSGGNGGVSATNGNDGGFGFGGGGAGSNGGAGGGGGAEGGDSGSMPDDQNNRQGKAGTSFFGTDALAPTLTEVMDCTSSDDGSVTLSFIPAPIPTLGQWGLIVLGLIIVIGGTVSLVNRRKTTLAK